MGKHKYTCASLLTLIVFAGVCLGQIRSIWEMDRALLGDAPVAASVPDSALHRDPTDSLLKNYSIADVTGGIIWINNSTELNTVITTHLGNYTRIGLDGVFDVNDTIPREFDVAAITNSAWVTNCTLMMYTKSCNPDFQYVDTTGMTIYKNNSIRHINSKWFGCVADFDLTTGTVNDVYVNRASICGSLSGFKPVYFSNGFYRFSDTITVGVPFIGADRGVVHSSDFYGSAQYNTEEGIGPSGCNFIWDTLTLDSSDTYIHADWSGFGGHPFIHTFQNIKFASMSKGDSSAGGYLLDIGVVNSGGFKNYNVLQNCEIVNFKGVNVSAISGQTFHMVRFRGCYHSMIGTNDVTGCTTINFDNCQFEGCGRGDNVFLQVENCYGLHFSNCIFNGSTKIEVHRLIGQMSFTEGTWWEAQRPAPYNSTNFIVASGRTNNLIQTISFDKANTGASTAGGIDISACPSGGTVKVGDSRILDAPIVLTDGQYTGRYGVAVTGAITGGKGSDYLNTTCQIADMPFHLAPTDTFGMSIEKASDYGIWHMNTPISNLTKRLFITPFDGVTPSVAYGALLELRCISYPQTSYDAYEFGGEGPDLIFRPPAGGRMRLSTSSAAILIEGGPVMMGANSYLKWNQQIPTSVSVNYGDTVGQLSRLAEDTLLYTIEEVANTPGIHVVFTVSGITSFSRVTFIGRYSGSTADDDEVSLSLLHDDGYYQNFNTISYDKDSDTSAEFRSFNNKSFFVGNCEDYINAGVANLRCYLPTLGDITHRLYIQQVTFDQ